MSRCSYCYTEGHNRRTCPQLTKRLEESAAAGSSYSQSMLNARGKAAAERRTPADALSVALMVTIVGLVTS